MPRIVIPSLPAKVKRPETIKGNHEHCMQEMDAAIQDQNSKEKEKKTRYTGKLRRMDTVYRQKVPFAI